MRLKLAHVFIIGLVGIFLYFKSENNGTQSVTDYRGSISYSFRPLSPQDVFCLADNIYHEARGETVAGQIAVAQVTLNRAEITGRSVCSVVYEKNQFSWVGKKATPSRKSEVWQQIKEIGLGVASGNYYFTELAHATYFHAIYVRPYWSKQFNHVATIGNHKFYSP